MEIPVEDDFVHTSPFGTVKGKREYLEIAAANRSQFLGFTFEIHDEIYDGQKACVRYTARKDDYSLEVSEWFFKGSDSIARIVSYYDLSADTS